MQNPTGARRARLFALGFLSSLGVCALPAAALADHPGAAWTVSVVNVEISPGIAAEIDRDAVLASVRSGLRRANEIYFYGDLPVGMTVTVRDNGEAVADVVITDILSGATLATTSGLRIGDNDLADRALAWMDRLSCPALGCDAPMAEPTALASAAGAAKDRHAPQSTTPEPTRGAVASSGDRIQTSQPDLAKNASPRDATMGEMRIAALVPIPQPRGSARPEAIGRDLIGTVIGRSVPAPQVNVAAPLRLARFDTSGLSEITYGDADRLILAVSAPRPVDQPISSSRRPNPSDNATVLETVFQSFKQLVGLSEDTSPLAAPARVGDRSVTQVPPSTVAVETDRRGKRVSVRDALAQANAPFRPSVRWQQVPVTTRDQYAGQETRFASLSVLGNGALEAPALGTETTADETSVPAVREIPSVQTPTTTASSVQQIQSQNRPQQGLSVRLHPEIFNRYAGQRVASLFAPRSRTAKPAAVPAETVHAALNDALSKRGLALDEATYSRSVKIVWDGRDRTKGFLLTLPEVVNFKYAMIATRSGSLVARVQSKPGPVHLSGAIAKALKMRRGEWKKVRIVALREDDQQAAAKTLGQVFTSARIIAEDD